MSADLVERLREKNEWTNQKPYFHAHDKCTEAADLIEAQSAEIDRLTKWKPIETAPDDDWFLAAIEVRHKSGGRWWEYHVIWLDDETNDVHTDCEQGWSISDYSHWVALPNAPYPLNAGENALENKP